MNKGKRNDGQGAGAAKRSRAALWTALLLLAVLLAGAVAAVAVSAADDYEVYATDLAPLSASAGDSGNLHYDEGPNGGTLTLRNAGDTMTFERGIFAHVDSEIVYDAQKYGIKHFSAYIGINDGAQGYKDRASADFEVFADTTSVYKSPILRIDDAAVLVDVDIPAGTKQVRLVTTQADDSNYSDHTVWGDAKFTLDGSLSGVLESVSLTMPSAVIERGKTEQLTLTAAAIGGKVIDNADLDSVQYTSSADGIISVTGEGKITGEAAGEATISVTATKGEESASAQLTVHCIDTSADGTVMLSSPGKNLSVLLTLSEEGKISYSVTSGSTLVLEPSLIGIEGEDAALSSGFTYVSQTEPREINETYKNYSGDRANGEDHCNEQSVVFSKDGFTYTVVLRAYDDGYAVRSQVAKEGQAQLVITDEKTAYTLPAGTNLRAIIRDASDFLDYTYSYEGGFSSKTIEAVSRAKQVVCFPALLEHGDGLYSLISEAEIYSSHNVMYGSCLVATGNNTLECNPAPKVEDNGRVTVDLPFQTPWRMGVVGDLATIVESDLVDNLNARPEGEQDLSWIEPGVTGWMWLSEGKNGQSNRQTIMDYVDLCAEMGWKYLILDEGWQPGAKTPDKAYDGVYSWFPRVLKYAEEKGVGFLVWVKHVDLDTDEERKVLHEWAQMGIKGIKADFFDTECQVNMADIQEIYRICGEEHLLCNFHGANKPTGERATYPWVISREAVQGQEYGGIGSAATAIWPYTRAAVGPVDITPTLYPTASSSTTTAHQMAINVVFEDGFPCMASDSEEYRNCSVKSYLKALPAKWDDLHFIEGAPGSHTVLARRSGSEWWVGGMTTSARTVTLPLDYLDAGKDYVAVLYADGEGRLDVETTIQEVRSDGSVEIKMPTNGGFVLRILPKEEATEVTEIQPESDVYTVSVGETVKVKASVVPADAVLSDLSFEVADSNLADISPNGTVTGRRPGITTVTVKNHDGKVQATVELRVSRPIGYYRSEEWTIVSEADGAAPVFSEATPNEAKMTIVSGDMDKATPPHMLLTDAPEGDFTIEVKVSGGLNANFQTVGPVVYGGAQNMIAMTRRSHSYFNGNVFCLQSYFNKQMKEPYVAETKATSAAYLRIEKKGNVFTGSYSYDGEEWTAISQTATAPSIAGASNLKVGIIACSGSMTAKKTVTVDDFKINGEVQPFMLYNEKSELVQLVPQTLLVPKGTGAAALPPTVLGYCSGGEFIDVPAAWTGSVDTSTLGEKTVEGKAAGEYESSALTVTYTLRVVERDELDLTGDGRLTIADASALVARVASPDAPLTAPGDLTGDGKVTVKDIARVLVYLGK